MKEKKRMLMGKCFGFFSGLLFLSPLVGDGEGVQILAKRPLFFGSEFFLFPSLRFWCLGSSEQKKGNEDYNERKSDSHFYFGRPLIL